MVTLHEDDVLTVSRAPRFEVVDLYRGFAALSIFVLHGYNFAGGVWLPDAYLGLDLFFLISGFVIANGFDRRIAAGMRLREFFLIRFVRFYPAYLLALLLATPLLILHSLRSGQAQDWGAWAGAISMEALMLPSVFDPRGSAQLYPINGVCWSLFFEYIVNLVYFCIFPWLSKRNFQILLVFCAVVWLLARIEANTLNVGYSWASAPYALPRLALPFFLGVYLRRYAMRKPWLPKLDWPSALTGVLLLLLFYRHSTFTGGQASVLGDALAVFVVMPLVLLTAAQSGAPQSLCRLSRYGGRISYPLYVLQDACFLLFAAAFSVVFKASAATFAPWSLLPLLIVSIALALQVDRHLEPWGGRLLRRWFGLPAPQVRIPPELLAELLAGPRKPLAQAASPFYRSPEASQVPQK